MNTLGTKQTEMCIRVSENRQEFPLAAAQGSHGAERFDILVPAIEAIRTSAYNQSRAQSAVRESSANVDATREELERQLEAIRKTVRILDVPGLEDKFLPARKVNDQGLLTLAQTYGNDALPLKPDLIRRGLGTDFIDSLAEAAQAFDAALNERSRQLAKQVEATAELDDKIEFALSIVREIGVIVRNVYARDPAKLALWESVSHVEKVGRRSRPADDDNEPPPPAQG